MAESRIDGIGVSLTNKGFEVSANTPRACSWSLGCDIIIEDIDADIQEINVNDITLFGVVSIENISVDIDADKTNIMNLDVSVVVNGISSSIIESQIVSFSKIVEITEGSPESNNESRFAASARSAKVIYDLIKEIEDRIKEIESNGGESNESIDEINKNIDRIQNSLDGLQVLLEWFEWGDKEHKTIRTRYNFFSDKEIASGAVGQEGSGGGGSGGGSGSIESASDVKIENLTGGDILVYDKDSTFWKNRPMTYFHPQNNAAEVWIITHNLGKYPNVKVLDSHKIQVFGDVQYLDENRVKVTFGGAFSGTAYLD